MKFQYEVGMPIVERDRHARKGRITSLESDGGYFLWEDEAEGAHEHWTGDYDVMPDTDEARVHLAEINKKTQAKIDEAASLLEQAFKAWHQAAAMQWYGEEQEEGFTETYVLRHNEDLDVSKFEAAIEEAGWSTSSLYC